MTRLLDVNVLVAIAWPNHVHHAAARRWFQRTHGQGWATCPVTESGFVRVSSNRRILPAARLPAEAIELLRRLTDVGGHVFWPDDVSMARSGFIDPDHIVGYRQVTDAHLVALALRHEGKLATFDVGVGDVIPAAIDPSQVLELIR